MRKCLKRCIFATKSFITILKNKDGNAEEDFTFSDPENSIEGKIE